MPTRGSALVTGAARGIGAACAVRLARDVSTVVLTDLDGATLAAVAADVERTGARAVTATLDVTDEEQVDAAISRAAEAGPLLAAVNCAGIGGPALPASEYPLEAWRSVLEVDLTGVFLCLRAELRVMVAAGRGAVVNVSSVLGTAAGPLAPAYTAAKHGVEGLTKSAALAHAADGVRVNAVAPGYVDTELLRSRSDAGRLTALADRHPVQRLGTAAEVADVVAFLLSDAAGFVTGSCYRVDGGYLTQG